MRLIPLLAVPPLLALTACHGHVDVGDGNAADGNVQVAMGGADPNRVAIRAPGFSADVSVPMPNLGGHVDFDGIKLAPTSKVNGLTASADDSGDRDQGRAVMRFSDSGSPAAVIAYYRAEANRAGFGGIVATGDALTARKGTTGFALTVHPAAQGSTGTIAVTGS